jgi:S-adenosyl-L-methionine hydrolase (adenosine-forming)
MKPVVSLITDFGQGYYPGQMRAQIRRISPECDIIDITHNVTPYNVCEGAFILSRSYNFFPKNTVHVAVVDPGVGSSRLPIAAETNDYIFVGPDNGILRWALSNEKITRMISINKDKIKESAGIDDVSPTFHGRDIFAPCAALICNGTDIDHLGGRILDLEGLEIMEDTVLHVDPFGNIITTIAKEIPAGGMVRVRHGPRVYEARAVKTFAEAEPGQLIVLRGSHGMVEVDICQGNAALKYGVHAGDKIMIENAR